MSDKLWIKYTDDGFAYVTEEGKRQGCQVIQVPNARAPSARALYTGSDQGFLPDAYLGLLMGVLDDIERLWYFMIISTLSVFVYHIASVFEKDEDASS